MDCGDLSDEELEVLDQLERLYAEIHYTEVKQQNDEQNDQNHSIVSSAPSETSRGTVWRYWHNSDHQAPINTASQKVNPQKPAGTPKNTPVTKNNVTPTPPNKNTIVTISKPKKERPSPPKISVSSDLLSFGSPLEKDTRTTIKIIENEDDDIFSMDLGTSDEDEVIEVALPPRPTITVESSDEDEISVVAPQQLSITVAPAQDDHGRKRPAAIDSRDVSASPVPSVASSVSDDFIRGDCIALNISSRRPDNPSFDFSLHGSDLLIAPSKKKKKKKNKDRDKSITPTALLEKTAVPEETNDLFATPKNKAKHKKQKVKNYAVTEKSIPNPDVYDSDSNQSFDVNKKTNYAVTEKSLPSADVYESDSSQSESTKTSNKLIQKKLEYHAVESTESAVLLSVKETQKIPLKTTPKSTNITLNTKVQKDQKNSTLNTSVVDLTDDLDDTVVLDDDIEENIVIANVIGFEESDDYGDKDTTPKDPLKVGSTKVPAILFSDLDFDNLKRNEKVCKKQQHSLKTLRAEMDKFYNESWGGEEFNHREIQKTMSRDKSLWEIDPKDRLPTPFKRKITCNYCHRVGHRTDSCRMRPPICHMCGEAGHHEPRCPYKICVNCGSPNFMYSTICRNCSTWGPVTCAECHQTGHPASHCPDYWRRYHNTIDNHLTLAKNPGPRKKNELFCSGCAGRGHLIHTCRSTIPFSGLPVNTPYVVHYKPVFPAPYDTDHSTEDNDKSPQNTKGLKRLSKSPVVHDTHVSKRRHLSVGDAAPKGNDKQLPDNSTKPTRTSTPHRARTQSENSVQKSITNPNTPNYNVEKAADYIAVTSTNHDKKGQIIQDNEVSDTSEAVTTSRIYLSSEVRDRLKSKEGDEWLQATARERNVETSLAESDLYMNVKGVLVGQEGFQAKLRDWICPTDTQKPEEPKEPSNNIPKNRNDVLRKLSNAFESLKEYLGEPKELFKELQYHQHNHHSLLKQKVLSADKLRNSSKHINKMLKKLNMVLLGQAGLADGILHLNELYTLKEHLTNKRTKNISLHLRKEIGEHYNCIFTSVPRTDYVELLREYYSPGAKLNLPFQPVAHQIQGVVFRPEPPKAKAFTAITWQKPKNFQNQSENIVRRLKHYHRMLNYDTNEKKRQGMARKLHIEIASALKNETLSKSAKKKIMKLQEAMRFLK